MPLDPTLKSWLKEHKMWLKNSKTGKEHTHNVMEYGCFLSIKDEFKNEFLKKLAITIDDRKINYLLEIRGDLFNFMVDVDFKSEYGLTKEQKLKLIHAIQTAVNSCIDNNVIDNNILIVSSCKDAKIMYQEQEMVKIGFHFIWPNLTVSMDEARFLRSAIIQYLDIHIESVAINDWETIIDNSIYDNKHGLRMNGSSKNIKCPKCKAKPTLRDQCIKCNRSGWFNEGRIYKPYLVMNNATCDKDMLLKLRKDTLKNLKMTSIRGNSNESIETNIFPEWFSKNKLAVHLYNNGKKKEKKLKICNPNNKYKPHQQDEISENSIIYKELIKYLTLQLFKLSPEYEDIEFDKLKKINLPKNKFLYILSTRSHYCLNMNREHSSNHIYFQVNGGKNPNIVQKCPSPWKNSKNEMCKDFKSKEIKLNEKLYNILFVITEKKHIDNVIPNNKKKRIRKFAIN